MADGSTYDRAQTRTGVRVRRHHRVIARWLAMLVIAVSAPIAIAQPVFSERDLDAAMKAVGRNLQLMQTALAARDVEGAKVRVARAREQLSPTVSFWRNRKETEALRLLKQAIASLDALDVALSKEPVDPGALDTAAANVTMACQSCHSVYRQQDPTSKAFSVKKQP